MECNQKITERRVIDIWYELKLKITKTNYTDVVEHFLCQILGDCGLKVAETTSDKNSAAYKTLKRRCDRIIHKVRLNKRDKKSKYNGYSDPEKLFVCESEFPKLFKKDVSKR